MEIITLDIDPIPKGRPRFTKFGHAYTPDRTRRYETFLKSGMALGMLESPYTGSLCIEIDFHIKKPKTTRYGQFPPLDLDNLVKSVLDAGNGILYKDDRQIVKIVAKKSWQVAGKIIIVMHEEE